MSIRDIILPHAPGPIATGVQPWSSPEQYVIFSIDGEGLTATRQVFEATIGVNVKPVEGCYKGKLEHSWIANARDWAAIAASGFLDAQESVLHLGPWSNGGRPATLHFSFASGDGIGAPSVPLGQFRQTAKDYALTQDAWTRDGTDFYICS